MSWSSEAVCIYCFQKLKGPVEPARVIDSSPESCALCGETTGDLPGIYLRLWRAKEEEEEVGQER